MSKEFDTKPNSSNCAVEAVPLVARQEYTRGWRFRKIALTTLVFLFVFFLGVILHEWCRDQMDGIHFYVYDTEQKVDGYWEGREKEHFGRTGVSPESPEGKKYMTKARKEWRPLVEVGPFFIFLCEEGDRRWFTVLERSTRVLIAQLASDEQSKELRLFSALEKDWNFPRFMSHFRYSEDGIYVHGRFTIFRKDVTPERVYFDREGNGVFDVMYVYENGVPITYYLHDLSWRRCDRPDEHLSSAECDCPQFENESLKPEDRPNSDEKSNENQGTDKANQQ